jgi:hypothetical protein
MVSLGNSQLLYTLLSFIFYIITLLCFCLRVNGMVYTCHYSSTGKKPRRWLSLDRGPRLEAESLTVNLSLNLTLLLDYEGMQVRIRGGGQRIVSAIWKRMGCFIKTFSRIYYLQFF